jgi:uncharacterized membrane protein
MIIFFAVCLPVFLVLEVLLALIAYVAKGVFDAEVYVHPAILFGATAIIAADISTRLARVFLLLHWKATSWMIKRDNARRAEREQGFE